MKQKLLIAIAFTLLSCSSNPQNSFPEQSLPLTNHSQTGKLSAAELLPRVLAQLKLFAADSKTELLQQKTLPYAANSSVMLLAEYVEQADSTTGLDFHILLVDNSSAKVISRFHETDASRNAKLGPLADLMMPSISIDRADYQLNSVTTAFGIRRIYSLNRPVMPYEISYISLFVAQNNGLLPLLRDYPIYQYSGEWDMHCAGQFEQDQAVISVAKASNNNFNDLLVTHKITTITQLAIDDTCSQTQQRKYITRKLSFNKTEYR